MVQPKLSWRARRDYRFCEAVIRSILDDVVLPVGYGVSVDRNRCTISKECLYVGDGVGVEFRDGASKLVKFRGLKFWVGDVFVSVERFMGDVTFHDENGEPYRVFRISDPDFAVDCAGYISEWLARGGL